MIYKMQYVLGEDAYTLNKYKEAALAVLLPQKMQV